MAILTGRRQQIRAKLVVGGLGQITACGLLLLLGPTSGVVLLLAAGFILGLPQGLVSLANQNAVYWQADPVRMGASAGLLRTFMYLGAMTASVANGAFFDTHADTAGLHRLAVFMLATAGLFLALTLVDRSLGRVGGTGRAAGEGGAVGGAAAVGTRAAG